MTAPETPHVVTSVTVQIEASAAFVWDVLVDYASYPEWNPYTIAVDTTLQVGDRIDLTLPSPDGSDGTFVNREFIRVVDPPHHLQYDTADEMAGIFGVRDQWITELAPDRCSYHTTDTLSGEHRRPGHRDERRLDQGRVRLGRARPEGPGRTPAGHPLTQIPPVTSGPRGTRTHNPRIKSPLLCQLS